MSEPARHEAIYIPKWALSFVVPVVLVVAMFVRTEIRTQDALSEIESIRAAAQVYKAQAQVSEQAEEIRFSALESDVQYLCEARARDDRESGRTPSGRDCRPGH